MHNKKKNYGVKISDGSIKKNRWKIKIKKYEKTPSRKRKEKKKPQQQQYRRQCTTVREKKQYLFNVTDAFI